MKKIMGLIIVLGLFISSCNMSAAESPDPQIATAAALTVQAVLNAVTPPLASPTLAPANPVVEPIQTQPPILEPLASVGEVLNCRMGPGTNYERIAQVLPNEPVKIIGFFPPNYWVVSTANGDCWLSGEFTTPSGDFAAVPTVTAPPTPLGGAPEAPSFSKNGWTWFCNGTGETDVELNWTDNANNEKGYRVYRNSELVAELPAGSTFFKETVRYPGGEGLTYSVEVFNEAGASNTTTAALFC